MTTATATEIKYPWLLKAEDELVEFLNLMTPEEVQEFREVVVAGHIVGWCFGSRIDGPGCFTGKAALIHKIDRREMFKLAGFDPEQRLRIEDAADYCNWGDTPEKNEVLAMVLGWVDDYIRIGNEHSN